MTTVLAVTGLGISSTGSALFRKVLFQLKGEGVDHVVHNFEKPWFTTFESGLACLVSLLLHWGHQRFRAILRWRRNRRKELQQPLLEKEAQDTQPLLDQERKTWKQLSVLAWPGVLNMLSIIVQGMGLQYISASVSQMISGSCIIFTAVLSVIILKRRLNWLHLTGIGLTLVAVVIVSLTNIFYPPQICPRSDPACLRIEHDGGAGNITLGILLTLASQIFQAVRLIMEESLLTKMDLHPMEVLGWEGFWGTLGMAVVGMPLAWIIPGPDIGGHLENTIDSVAMLWNDGMLNGVNVLFFWSVVGLNVFGLMVTQVLGSVFRAVMLTARTASVWAVDLVLYSMLPKGLNVGEAWTNPASWIQLFGFSLLLAGTVIYAQGSSPAAHDKGDDEGFSSEDEADGPAPPPKRSTIANFRPLYSIYVPHSDRQAHVVPIPTANPEDLHRSSSVPTDVEAAVGEGQHTPQPLGGRGSLPSELKGRLPSRGSLINMLQRGPADAGSTTSGESGDLPMGRSPSFYRTLTHRTSWIIDKVELWHSPSKRSTVHQHIKDDQRLKGILLRAGVEVITNGEQSRERGLTSIPEDTTRLSSLARNGSGGPSTGKEGRGRTSSSSQRETASRSEKSVLGQSPTAEVFMERQSSSKQPLKHLAALPEHEPGLPNTASEQSEASDMFNMDMPTPRGI